MLRFRPTRIQPPPYFPRLRPRVLHPVSTQIPRRDTAAGIVSASTLMSDGDDTSVTEEEEEDQDVDNLTPESRASTFSRMGRIHMDRFYRTRRDPIAIEDGHASHPNMHAGGEQEQATSPASRSQDVSPGSDNTLPLLTQRQPTQTPLDAIVEQGQVVLRTPRSQDPSPATSDNMLPLLPRQPTQPIMDLPFASPAQPPSSSVVPTPAHMGIEPYRLSRPPLAPRRRPSPPPSPTPMPKRRRPHYEARDIFEDPPEPVDEDRQRFINHDPGLRALLEAWNVENVVQPLEDLEPLEPPQAPRRSRLRVHPRTTD